ncbi:hypothetical protein GCM10023194_68750 [Planotetraspora phitsanulokensis]|uniref:Uncharacterized protein n=1 Tax=Planotetraspora phitsanulokensis TaxID=575192 RepID=A0A8J3XFE1_9ACTN|nr:hypothetical protein [Planotetraspora phitsanulokensis]GII39562.1 hypothetical protein Pph01_45650 [Planotetraspora phitsanulokensis]
MTDKKITTIGRCYACKRTFAFDPGTVMMFSIDPETGLIPGMTVFGGMREPTPEALARAIDVPICPDCVSKAKQFVEADDPSVGWKRWPADE